MSPSFGKFIPISFRLMQYQIQTQLFDLTLGPQFTTLFIQLLTFTSQLMNQDMISVGPSDIQDVERGLLIANDRHWAVQNWPSLRVKVERQLMFDLSNGVSSAVVEDDRDGPLEGDSPVTITSDMLAMPSGERKRDRLGSKLRGVFSNLPSAVTSPLGATFGSSSGNYPLSPPPPPFKVTSRPLSPINNQYPFPTPSFMFSKTGSFTQSPPTTNDVKVRPSRHSIQMLPKSQSTFNFSSKHSNGGPGGKLMIRGTDPDWIDLKERQGRKKRGWLWCAGDRKGSGDAVKGGNWESEFICGNSVLDTIWGLTGYVRVG